MTPSDTAIAPSSQATAAGSRSRMPVTCRASRFSPSSRRRLSGRGVERRDRVARDRFGGRRLGRCRHLRRARELVDVRLARLGIRPAVVDARTREGQVVPRHVARGADHAIPRAQSLPRGELRRMQLPQARRVPRGRFDARDQRGEVAQLDRVGFESRLPREIVGEAFAGEERGGALSRAGRRAAISASRWACTSAWRALQRVRRPFARAAEPPLQRGAQAALLPDHLGARALEALERARDSRRGRDPFLHDRVEVQARGDEQHQERGPQDGAQRPLHARVRSPVPRAAVRIR